MLNNLFMRTILKYTGNIEFNVEIDHFFCFIFFYNLAATSV